MTKDNEQDPSTIQAPQSPCSCHPPNHGFPHCSQCGDLMCPGTLAYGTTLCGRRCRFNPQVLATLNRDQHGRVIDPGNGNVLRTCICGMVAHGGLYPCGPHFFHPNSGHRLIVPPTNN